MLTEYSSEAGVSGVKKVKNPLIFFLNLEKFNGIQSQICNIIVNDQEKTDPNIILNEIRNFFKKGDSKPPTQINNFVDKVQLSKLNITEIDECDN